MGMFGKLFMGAWIAEDKCYIFNGLRMQIRKKNKRFKTKQSTMDLFIDLLINETDGILKLVKKMEDKNAVSVDK